MLLASQLHSPENEWHESKERQHYEEHDAGDRILVGNVFTDGLALERYNKRQLSDKQQTQADEADTQTNEPIRWQRVARADVARRDYDYDEHERGFNKLCDPYAKTWHQKWNTN